MYNTLKFSMYCKTIHSSTQKASYAYGCLFPGYISGISLVNKA
ncbi:MAG: hypothetical protein JETT_0862 [Candidatus Jettenia ecosi]|uniref:Uncharacterized protein n=1 Tax=Candidatus Jettenia ecosi TaxID=2494326 RepID=A0A533QQH1_9BACT|nr:MAG: hypothetical protein JETT_0862 [Candidatus Jettenia ecosi]